MALVSVLAASEAFYSDVVGMTMINDLRTLIKLKNRKHTNMIIYIIPPAGIALTNRA